MDVHEEFPLNVPKVILDVSLLILIMYVQTTKHVARWKADSIFVLGHKWK